MTEQLDLYLHQILLSEENKFEQYRLDQLKTIKRYALKIIDFIAQFEEELVKIWNKPKFVLNSNYVITLDQLHQRVVEKIYQHPNLEKQIKEWKDLQMVSKDFDFSQIQNNDLLKSTNGKYQFLPIDTKFFKDLEFEILGQFENLDHALDGRLIHSENYQALNTLKKRYKGKVQCIYIDPPFNLGSNADFSYQVNYKDANWTTLLENRLQLAHELLADTGSIFVRCDDNGNFIVRCLLDSIFGKENFRNEIVVGKSNRIKTKGNKYLSWYDCIFYYCKSSENFYFNHLTKSRDKEEWRSMDNPNEGWKIVPKEFLDQISQDNINYDKDNNPISRARIILGKECLPPPGRGFIEQEKIIELEKKEEIKLNDNGIPQMKKPNWVYLTDNWTDIFGYSSTTGFTTENSEKLLERVILTATQENDLVLDFFAGSATTQAVAQKLGRKWLGVEMGDQFFSVDLPRLKQVLFGKQSGISKDLRKKYKGSGFFKYFSLEQYEDTLRKMKYKDYDQQELWASDQKTFEEYLFATDEKFSHVLEVKDESLDIDFDKLYQNIDFAETIAHLKGLPIEKISKTDVLLEGDKEEICTDYHTMNDDEKLEFLRLFQHLLWWGK